MKYFLIILVLLSVSCSSNVVRENPDHKEIAINENGRSFLMVYSVTNTYENIFGIRMSLKYKNWWNCGTGSCSGLKVSKEQMERVCKTENPNSNFLKKENNISLNKDLYFLCYEEKPLQKKV